MPISACGKRVSPSTSLAYAVMVTAAIIVPMHDLISITLLGIYLCKNERKATTPVHAERKPRSPHD